MKIKRSFLHFIIVLGITSYRSGYGESFSEIEEQTSEKVAKNMQVSVKGQLKPVLIFGEDCPFSSLQLFLMAEPNIYHLTFDSLCTVEGGSVSKQDGDGIPMVIGEKHFLIHSGSTYQIRGVQHTKGSVLSTRPTIPLLVSNFICVTASTDTSYAFVGWKSGDTLWAPPEALAATGILVNDGKMTMKVKDGRFIIGGGVSINTNSIAPCVLAAVNCLFCEVSTF